MWQVYTVEIKLWQGYTVEIELWQGYVEGIVVRMVNNGNLWQGCSQYDGYMGIETKFTTRRLYSKVGSQYLISRYAYSIVYFHAKVIWCLKMWAFWIQYTVILFSVILYTFDCYSFQSSFILFDMYVCVNINIARDFASIFSQYKANNFTMHYDMFNLIKWSYL